MPNDTYATQAHRDANSQSVFTKRKDMVEHGTIEGERKEKLKRWITFYRRNPHRFIQEYFGIKLFPYQILMIWVLQRSTLGYIVASRAAAKSWIIAVWALTLAVLYPSIKVIVCAKTIKQGGIILSEKLTSLRDTYPNVAREIRNITTNANINEAIFHNGSTIKTVPSSESSRGNRANYIVVEESRLVPKDILEAIIKPFLFSRTPPYRLKVEYSGEDDLREEGIISYITSAWYKSEYWFSYVKSTIRRMVNGDKTANFLAFDYLISIYHNIKTMKMIENETEDADTTTVQMEYLNIPSGQSGKSYFTLSLFKRNMKRAFYPQRKDTYQTKNPYGIKRISGEIRILSVDVATRANKENDQTIISCARLIPQRGKGYHRHLVYMESHKGKNTILQAKRIKEIFFDFECDWIVLDLANAGISIFDALSQVTEHEERGVEFPPMSVVDHNNVEEKLKDELLGRTLGLDPMRVIFPILATKPLNSKIAVAFRNSLQKKMWSFLLSEIEIEDFLIKTYKDYMSNEESYRAFYLQPYVNTNLFINECVNLDMILSEGHIKLVEGEGSHKDRYTSVSYLNYVATFFDKDLLKETDNFSDEDAILEVSFIG